MGVGSTMKVEGAKILGPPLFFWALSYLTYLQLNMRGPKRKVGPKNFFPEVISCILHKVISMAMLQQAVW